MAAGYSPYLGFLAPVLQHCDDFNDCENCVHGDCGYNCFEMGMDAFLYGYKLLNTDMLLIVNGKVGEPSGGDLLGSCLYWELPVMKGN